VTKDYESLLRDPRWQRRRLEIFGRDAWRCVHCGDHTSTLCVHHVTAYRGISPWEYKDDELQTLCEGCHGLLKGLRPGSVILCAGGGYSYDGRCPKCGSDRMKDKGSYDKCTDCGFGTDIFFG